VRSETAAVFDVPSAMSSRRTAEPRKNTPSARVNDPELNPLPAHPA
jgi:hypothetical protein